MFQRLENSINRLDAVSSQTLKRALGDLRAGKVGYSLLLFTVAVQQAQAGSVITDEVWQTLLTTLG